MILLQDTQIDCALIYEILERGNDVWIKQTRTGIVIIEATFTKRMEIGDKP